MKKLVIAAASAVLLAGTAIASAQEAQGTEETEILKKKKPDANSATEAAPGQQQKSGEVDAAKEAAPGQQQKSGEVDSATEATPGQVKKQDQATGKQMQEQQNSGQAQGEQQPAPGEQPSDQAQGEQKPSSETTGSININTEQRTEITQIFRSEKVDRIDVDFEVNVGVVVPRTVTLRPLPTRVIEIVPAYRGYEYFVLADGRIIIVEPGTLKIVYILVV
jgi:hypothetical protein